jgi:hypothetical protein
MIIEAEKVSANIHWLRSPGVSVSHPMFELISSLGMPINNRAVFTDRIHKTVTPHEHGYTAHLEPPDAEELLLIADVHFNEMSQIFDPGTNMYVEKPAHQIHLNFFDESDEKRLSYYVDPGTGELMQVSVFEGHLDEEYGKFLEVLPDGRVYIHPEGFAPESTEQSIIQPTIVQDILKRMYTAVAQ